MVSASRQRQCSAAADPRGLEPGRGNAQEKRPATTYQPSSILAGSIAGVLLSRERSCYAWAQPHNRAGRLPIAQVLVVAWKLLAVAGFLAALVFLARWGLPRSAARVTDRTAVYPGGMTSRMITGSYGTARLKLLDGEVAVLGRGPFRALIRWRAGYGEISQATAVRGPGKSGVLLRVPSGPIAFWSPRWPEILGLLELRGVPVSRVVTKISWKDFY